MKPGPPPSDDTAAAAAGWVLRRRAGLDAEGEREFVRWHDAAPAHAAAYRRLDALSEVFARARAQGAASAIVTGLHVRARRRARRRLLLATGTAMVLFAGWWWPRATTPAGSSRPAAVAQVFEPLRRLPDGSIVELRAGAQVEVRFDATRRRVELLRGEALFRVEPDPARPFVVTAAGVDARAVGTAYSVRLEPKVVAVLVTEGTVRLQDSATGESILPAASTGESPVLTAGQESVVARIAAERAVTAARCDTLSPDEIRRRLAWRVPRFEFDGVELGAAAQAMNRINRIQLALADDRLARLKISGDFAQDDPETFARLAAATFGLTLKQEGTDRLLLGRE